MGHLFVSYCRDDAEYADQLASHLEAAGVDLWIDRGEIQPGARYRRTIEAAINDCEAFLVVMSPAAKESKWVESELDWAERRGKSIFTLLLDGDVWFGLTATHYEDVTGGRLPSDQFIQALPGQCENNPVAREPIPAPTAPSLSSSRPFEAQTPTEQPSATGVRMNRVFISYRRDDTLEAAQALHDRLELHLGYGRVFIDDGIAKQTDHADAIRTALREATVVVVIVGHQWLAPSEETGRPRILDEGDWVRIELETALAREVPMFVVRVDLAPMPEDDDLPYQLKGFNLINAENLRSETFNDDLERIRRQIERLASTDDKIAVPDPDELPGPRAAGPEPSSRSLGQLDEMVREYENRPELSFENFSAYLRWELEYENELLSSVAHLKGDPDDQGYEAAFLQVAEMNRRMANICARELTNDPSPNYRQELLRWLSESNGLELLARAEIHANRATQLRMLGLTQEAFDEQIQARQFYEQLAQSGHPQAIMGEVKAQISMYVASIIDAQGRTGRGQHRAALDKIREARLQLHALIENLNRKARMQGEEPEKAFGDLHGELTTEVLRIKMMNDAASFHLEYQQGEMERAVQHAGDYLAARTSDDIVQSGAAGVIVQLELMDRQAMEGWYNLASAELALDEVRPGDAVRCIETARHHWQQAIDTGLRSGVPLGANAQNLRSEGGLLIAAVERRVRQVSWYER